MRNSGTISGENLKTDWGRFTIIVFSGVIAAMQIGKVIVFLTPLQKDFNISLQSAGWIMSIFAVIGVVFMAPGAALVDRFGDKRLLVLGLAGILLGSICTMFTYNFPVLLVLRSLEGFGFLLISVAGPAVIQRIVAQYDKDIAFSLWSCFMPAGIVIAILTGALVSSWKSYWMYNSGAVLILLLLIIFSIHRKTPSAAAGIGAGQMWRQIISVFKVSGMPQMFFSFTMYNIQYFTVITFLPALIQQNTSISSTLASALSAAVAGINIVGNIAAGTLLKKGFLRWKILLTGSLLMMITGALVFSPIPMRWLQWR
jgi:predicted MFS family arabinose efflux permease